ncbi:MAG: ABC transporter ATP-binding protein [Deltaproteobacteria bacterium]|nr:ABC transporter ATP-binding protein [Deltaproteobacteria bacterium]
MNSTHSLKEADNRSVILSVKHVTKYFGGLTALGDVSFELYEHEILGLIGPNGAGKTTLFHLIAGVYKPDKGNIHLRGEQISGLRPDIICKKGIARTFQITKPFLEMSTLENVMVGSYFGSHGRRSLKECQKPAENILLLAGLAGKDHVTASHLTLVERKRLELARVLSTKPSIVLLDEVVAGLNPTEILEMVELIKKIRAEGITILMIEHVMKAIMGVSDRVIALNYGRKIAEGTPEEIVSNQEVIEAYLGGKADVVSG